MKEDYGYGQNFIWNKYFDYDFVFTLTILFILRSYISLRSLLRLYQKTIDYHTKGIRYIGIHMPNSYNLPIAIQLRLIQDLFGDYEHMRSALNKCLDRKEIIQRFNSYFPSLLFTYINYEREVFNSSRVAIHYDNKDLIIEYSKNDYNLNSVRVFEPNSEDPKNLYSANQDFIASDSLCWKVMIDTVERLHKVGYL